MDFEWDAAKAQANISKHGVSSRKPNRFSTIRFQVLWMIPTTPMTKTVSLLSV